MPELTSLLALTAATIVLVLIPGPNVALIVANSLSRGFRFGAATVRGTTLGVGLQLALVVFGLAAVLTIAAEALAWLKWIGVAYLFFLGVQAFRARSSDLALGHDTRRATQAIGQGAMLAILNPKTLLFNAAFLPQFVTAEASTLQVAVLGSVYLLVLTLGDLLWAGAAHQARPLLEHASRWPNRILGTCYLSAAFGLALARTER